jgi:hypothetical protein
LECDVGKSSYAGSSSCDIAAEGYYIDIDGSSQECPSNAACSGGLNWPVPLEGYYIDRSNIDTADRVDRCHRKTCIVKATANVSSCWLVACYADADMYFSADDGTVNIECKSSVCEGKSLQCMEGSDGVLCGSCSDGYTYSSSAQTCLACEIGSWDKDVGFIVICVAIGAGCMILFLGYLSRRSTKEQEEAEGFGCSDWSIFRMMKKIVDTVCAQNKTGVLRVLVRHIESLYTVCLNYASPPHMRIHTFFSSFLN